MAKFNVKGARPRVGTTPIVAPTGVAPIVNHQGGKGYARDAKSELFMLGISNLVGEKTFGEDKFSRNERFTDLIHAVIFADKSAEWMEGFLPWLRREMNLRSAPVMGAMDAAHAMLEAGIPGGRQLIYRTLDRPDEPGEALAYWMTHYGRTIPKPVKRGIGDAARRLYSERALLKYDTGGKPVGFADVIELCHPKPGDWWRSDLFRYALDKRHGRRGPLVIPDSLKVIQARASLQGVAVEDLDEKDIRDAGMTWQNTLSAAKDKKAAWEKQILSGMPYMALLRNLRNFDEAGVSDVVAAKVIEKLTDPKQVHRSRQFPFRFLSAAREVNNLRWAYPLEVALNLSLQNVPELKGKTLILVDFSASMFMPLSGHGSMLQSDIAALFGSALHMRNRENSTLVVFGNTSATVSPPSGMSILNVVKQFGGNRGGTATFNAIERHLAPHHTRVILITDEQHQGTSPHFAVPENVPLYVFNLVGYKAASMPTNRNRVTIGGGLTDASFRLIALLEAGRDGVWPWMQEIEPDDDIVEEHTTQLVAG